MAVKFDQLLINTYLERAVTEFSTNPLSARLIRRMATEVPDLFVAAALKYLDSADQSSAHHFLTSLMLRQQCVFEEVADPARGPLPRSVNLFKRLLKIDPSFDVKLARKLPDRNGLNHAEAFDTPRSCRVLDVLHETSVGRRLVPILGHLVESSDKLLAAKATLFIGKRIQSPEWAARQMTRSNPEEVRANAVESIWGVNSPSAHILLEDYSTDESSQVAGNALVGLHKLGKPGIMQQISGMVTASTPVFRSTAAWTMGKIGDSVFLDPLTELLKDDHPDVRSAALQSLLQIRRAAPPVVVKKPVVPEPVVPEPVVEPVAAEPIIEPVAEAVVEPVVEVPEPAAPIFEIDICLDGSRHKTKRWGR